MDLSSATEKAQLAEAGNAFRFRVNCARFGFAAGALDVFGTVCASISAHFLYRVTAAGSYGFYSVESAVCVGLIAGFLYVLTVRSAGLYDLSAFLYGKKLLLRISLHAISAVLLLIVFLFLLRAGPNVSRGTFLYFVPLQQIFILSSRLLSTRLAKTLTISGHLVGRPALLVGDGPELQQITGRYLLAEFGLQEVGRIPISSAVESGVEDALAAALALSRTAATQQLVVAIDWSNERKLERIREGLRRSALPALLLPDATVRRVAAQCIGLPQRSGVRAITLQRAPMPTVTLAFKRLLDIGLASFAIAALAPIMAATAVAIKWESDGPVIFRQRRHGFDRRPFTIFKFRSMTVLEDGAQILQATRGDKRVTRVGAFLRRTSLDELPQLFNVVLGHMSLVGPRPHALAHDNIYSDLIDRYYFRHHVKPGITGWAQINGARGQTQAIDQMKRRVDLDLWYIDHCSIWLDLLILARTCVSVLKDDAF